MVLSLSISAQTEAKLAAKAAAAGVDISTYVGTLIEETVKPPLTLKAISGQMADDFAATGMTDDELGDLLEETKHEMRSEKRSGRAS
ncbi:MAG: hypothetical protein H7144_13265 [Burkholderiales bacterium]|nr:hypothetical protein [Phycisphaerae bacterium]